MAKVPRKNSIGWHHTVEPGSTEGVYWVSGPTLNESFCVMNKDDAESIAAALNFAWNYEAMKRKAAALAGELGMFNEFK
jgi:hypothetical protein